MFKQSDKQKFISTMVNNIGYFNKQITIKQVNQFLKSNTNFVPRQAVRKAANDSYLSFIQLTGHVQIDKSFIQMYIGIPKSYPYQPPVFILAIDRKIFNVHDEQKLLQYNLIALQKNQSGQDFLRLRFPMLQKQWNPRDNTLNKVYTNLIQMINRPPILKPKQQQMRNGMSFLPNQGGGNMMGNMGNMGGMGGMNNNNNPTQKIQRLNSKQVTKFIGTMYTDITQLLISKQNLQQSNSILDYNISRQIFLKQHLQNLNLKLIANRSKIQNQSQILKKDIQDIQINKKCDKLLQVNEQQNKKLDVLSQQQVLKQAQVKLRSKIQKQTNTKFSDYKKIMKVLYDRMFDNQTKLLKLLK